MACCSLSGTDLCVEPQEGLVCKECNDRGYLVNETCVCFSAFSDPSKNCALYDVLEEAQEDGDARFVLAREAQQQLTEVKYACDCFQSKELGFYMQTADPYPMGYGSAPERNWCDSCLAPIFGPAPQSVTQGVACNMYGGPDPNSNSSQWEVCSGHGSWNADLFQCECTHPWVLQPAPQVAGLVPATCAACSSWYGPTPGSDSSPYCIYVMTPDPLDGIEKECGGHGIYNEESDSCVCDEDWGLLKVSEYVYSCINETLTS